MGQIHLEMYKIAGDLDRQHLQFADIQFLQNHGPKETRTKSIYICRLSYRSLYSTQDHTLRSQSQSELRPIHTIEVSGFFKLLTTKEIIYKINKLNKKHYHATTSLQPVC